MIADISEMAYGEDDSRRVVGYYLNRPCIIKMRNPNTLEDMSEGRSKKSGYEVSLFPWMPLSAEDTIPLPSAWVVTMVEPTIKLQEVYVADIVNYGKDNQSDSTGEQSDSDQPD